MQQSTFCVSRLYRYESLGNAVRLGQQGYPPFGNRPTNDACFPSRPQVSAANPKAVGTLKQMTESRKRHNREYYPVLEAHISDPKHLACFCVSDCGPQLLHLLQCRYREARIVMFVKLAIL